jgi:altronate hydrolase
MATHAITDLAIILKPEDDVAIAKREIPAGTILEDAGGRIEVRQDIKPGHKVARRAKRTSDVVRRYGQPIGFATADIAVGDHVHTQNLAVGDLHQEYEFCTDVKPVDYYPPSQMRFFDGYRREDGRVGTRNYVAIISGVNCSASVSQFVKEKFRDVQRDYPNIDGVLAITHKSGCGTKLFGEDHMALQRVLAGYAKHPNVAAYILIGLGCEVNQAAVMVDKQRMAAPGHPERKPMVVNIQEAGGIRKTVEKAAAEVAKLLPYANEAKRTKQPISELTLATNCGGSDGNSGITANPALGWAVDELVRYGGTGVLAETPEIYGAEHLLIRRAINEGVAKKLIDRYKWWEWYCRGIEAMDNNPAPGNKAGGLTTVLEKSLGGIAKGGSTNLNEVYEYAQPVRTPGLVFMDTPGYDPVSATGQVAGGANLICFTTGRGSAYGCAPSPSVKLATNTALWQRQSDDMDLNCGAVLDGSKTIDELGTELFQLLLDTASGQRSRSELHGYGQNEFVPWQISVVT